MPDFNFISANVVDFFELVHIRAAVFIAVYDFFSFLVRQGRAVPAVIIGAAVYVTFKFLDTFSVRAVVTRRRLQRGISPSIINISECHNKISFQIIKPT